MPKSRRKQTPLALLEGGCELHVGDCVLVNPEEGHLPYLGQIKNIKQGSKGLELLLAWYYRPEDVVRGRQPFHGKQELFISNHKDYVSLETIISL
jgi:BAH domain